MKKKKKKSMEYPQGQNFKLGIDLTDYPLNIGLGAKLDGEDVKEMDKLSDGHIQAALNALDSIRADMIIELRRRISAQLERRMSEWDNPATGQDGEDDKKNSYYN